MKELHVATDFADEVHHNQCFYEERHLDALMAYCRRLGATTIDWIVNTKWTLYEDYPGSMDLLAAAIQAAHRHGLEFHAVIKPFDGVRARFILPQSLPQPEDAPFWEDLHGLAPIVLPFVAEHPEFCMKRRPGEWDPPGPVRAIRLVKGDDSPVSIGAEDLSIWTGRTNGRFDRYEGAFTLTQRTEWRPLFPLGKTCRILSIEGLNIPEGQRYIEVRLADRRRGEPFANEAGALLELVGDDGRAIPGTGATNLHLGEAYMHQLAQPFMRRLVRYARLPEVSRILDDPQLIRAHGSEMRAYGGTADVAAVIDLAAEGRAGVARGKCTYLLGVLNPVYPEVRAHWLELTRYCIERGANAVNYRPSFHLQAPDRSEFGYNEPVLEQVAGRTPDTAEVARINGNAYTQFLREARELLHGHGRRIGVHLLSHFLAGSDDGKPPPILPTLDYQWETWVREIADIATFRGAMGLRRHSLELVVDRFALACREAGIPFVYQSNRRIFDAHRGPEQGRLRWLAQEMSYAFGHQGIAAHQLYETANFSRLNEHGEWEGSEDVLEIVQTFGLGKT